MKIYFSETPLVDDGETPKNFSVSTKRKSQTEYIVESRNARIFDRGNAVAEISFTSERAHESAAQAQKFSVSHAESISAQSPSTLSFTFDDGSQTDFQNAVLSKLSITIDGMMSSAKYEFAANTANR